MFPAVGVDVEVPYGDGMLGEHRDAGGLARGHSEFVIVAAVEDVLRRDR